MFRDGSIGCAMLHVIRGYIYNLGIRVRSLKSRDGSLDLRSGFNGPM